jgi:hypothetical protein
MSQQPVGGGAAAVAPGVTLGLAGGLPIFYPPSFVSVQICILRLRYAVTLEVTSARFNYRWIFVDVYLRLSAFLILTAEAVNCHFELIPAGGGPASVENRRHANQPFPFWRE